MLDNKQATLLGFTNAGWETFRKQLVDKGTTVYTTTTPVLERKNFIYRSSHGPTELKIKSQQKMKGVSSALKITLGILNSLQVIAIINEEDIQYFLLDIEAKEHFTQAMLDFIIETSEQSYGEKVLYDENQRIELYGYYFVRLLSDDNELQQCLIGHDAQKYSLFIIKIIDVLR